MSYGYDEDEDREAKVHAFVERNPWLVWLTYGVQVYVAVRLFSWAMELYPQTGFPRFIRPLGEWMRANVSTFVFEGVFVAVIIIIGTSLYSLRIRSRRLYAAIEFTFGTLAATYGANEVYYTDVGQEWSWRSVVSTVAGIYIIVRALDNWNHKTA